MDQARAKESARHKHSKDEDGTAHESQTEATGAPEVDAASTEKVAEATSTSQKGRKRARTTDKDDPDFVEDGADSGKRQARRKSSSQQRKEGLLFRFRFPRIDNSI